MKMNNPSLRFKAADSSYPDWKKTAVGQMIEMARGKYDPETSTVDFPCIEMEHIDQGTGRLLGSTSSLGLKSQKNKFNKGDVLFGKLRPYLRKYAHAPFDGVCSTEIWVLRGNGMSQELLHQFVQTEKFIGEANKSAGSKMPRADWSVVAALESALPCPEEQQKIASFLNAIDTRIDQLTQKHALLVEYKKGVMQKVFSQEVRFKDVDGSEFPEWRKVAVGELGEFSGGGTPSKSVESYWQGNIPWISSSDVDEDFCTRPNVQKFISAEALKESPTKIIPSGSILIVSRVGVGKIAIAETEICTSQDFTNLTLKNDDANYVGNWLHFNSEKIRALSQGTSIKGVTTDDLKALIIDLPSVAEQKKIADLIKSLDVLIAKETSSIHELKAYKQGLLQAMFV
jgi:type I restriction enzyme, S subunit